MKCPIHKRLGCYCDERPDFFKDESKSKDPISTECEHEWVYVCGIFKGSSSTTEMKWRCKKCLITRITYE